MTRDHYPAMNNLPDNLLSPVTDDSRWRLHCAVVKKAVFADDDRTSAIGPTGMPTYRQCLHNGSSGNQPNAVTNNAMSH